MRWMRIMDKTSKRYLTMARIKIIKVMIVHQTFTRSKTLRFQLKARKSSILKMRVMYNLRKSRNLLPQPSESTK